jgi:hypothetical protein
MTYKIPKYITNKIVSIEKQRRSLRYNIDINIKNYVDIDDSTENATIRKLKGPTEFNELCQILKLDPVSLVKLKAYQKSDIIKNHWTLDEFNNQRLQKRVEFFRKQLAAYERQATEVGEELYHTIHYQVIR